MASSTAAAAGETSETGSTKRARPFLKWAGGKSKLLGELLPRLPQSYSRYVEPMVGGGALFFAVRPAHALLLDVNSELVNCYRVVQTKVEELIEELSRHRYEERYFYEMRDADRTVDFLGWSDVARAARTIYLNKCCFNGLYRVNSRGNFNVPFGRYENPAIVAPAILRECSAVLASAKLCCSPIGALLSKTRAGDFVYLDPPYVPVSKTASFAHYARDGFDWEDQMKLKEICVALDRSGVAFMLSNSRTDSVVELYQEFRVEIVQAPRAINSKGALRGDVPEVIVRNY